jgi:hypothetical protein
MLLATGDPEPRPGRGTGLLHRQPISDGSGVLLYPNGQRVVDGFGKEYYPNGTRLVNDHGDEIRNVRYEFPSGNAVITVGADLTAGRLDRAGIAAICTSGR